MDEVEEVDELGPVDWIVVEFPGSRFNGQIAPALLDLVEREQIGLVIFGHDQEQWTTLKTVPEFYE